MVFTVKTILLSTHRFVQVLAGSPLVYGSCSVHQLTFVKYFSLDQLLFLLAHFAAIFAQNSRTPTVQERENSNRKAGTASLWKRNRLHNKTLKVPFNFSAVSLSANRRWPTSILGQLSFWCQYGIDSVFLRLH